MISKTVYFRPHQNHSVIRRAFGDRRYWCVARSDGDYEVSRLPTLIASCDRYALDDVKQAHYAKGRGIRGRGADTVRFTRAIKECVAYEERLAVIEALWQIALADGERDAEEDALIRLVASLLGITDVDSAIARQKVS